MVLIMLKKANVESMLNNLLLMGLIDKEDYIKLADRTYTDYYALAGTLEYDYCVPLNQISIKQLEDSNNG